MPESLRSETAIAPDSVTEDGFLGQRLRLRQPGRGHRAGSDAVLLAAAAPLKVDGPALDVGAGIGAAGLALAELRPGVSFGLLENDPFLAALGHENLAQNCCGARGSVYEVDVLDGLSRARAGLKDGSAGLVLTNPPFLDQGKVRISPDPGKSAAHVMPAGVTLETWIKACLALLTDGGIFLMIHRPDALPMMLAALGGRAGDVMLKPIHPQQGMPAVRLLLRAKKASRGALALASPLILHEGQNFTAEAEALHRGDALLTW